MKQRPIVAVAVTVEREKEERSRASGMRCEDGVIFYLFTATEVPWRRTLEFDRTTGEPHMTDGRGEGCVCPWREGK